MTWTIYLLSILDGAVFAAGSIVFVCAAAALVCAIVAIVTLVESHSEYCRDREKHTATHERFRGYTIKALVFLGCAIVLRAAVPTQDSIMTAYLMTEGSKIATADNTKTVAVEVRDQLRTIVKALSK